MSKNSKHKLLFITLFLTILLISSAYAVLIPDVHAAEMTTQQKGLAILSDVVGLDTAKYTLNTKDYPQDSYLDVLPQENVRYELDSNESKMAILYTFANGKIQMIHVLENEGLPRKIKDSTSALEMAMDFLGNYQSYSGNSFYGELRSSLANVDAGRNLTKTVGNTRLEVTALRDRVDFRWTYTLNGIEAPDKVVDLGYENGFLKFFIDTWDLYNIGSTIVNVSETQAMNKAIAYARNYSWPIGIDNGTVPIKNFNVTGAMIIETVFRSSLIADTPRNENVLTLYPMRHVWVSLDKFYPGNVYGFNVYVWADTGSIAHIQERICTMDPPQELVATVPESIAPSMNEQLASVETASNSLPTTWLALSAFAAITLSIANVRLSKKRGLIRRLSKTGGALLCVLTLSIFLLPIATVYAPHPYSQATIWGSESTGAYRNPPGWSWRKHPNEVAKQIEVADSVEQSFQGNGYNVAEYQGDTVQGLQGAILAKIADNEANYPRTAIVDFDHGNGAVNIPGLPSNEFHYMFEDNYGTRDGSTYENPGPMLHSHAVYDKDIYQQTTGKTFFAFISTCNSAHVNDSGSFWGVYYPVTQGLVDGSPLKARGMPFAWSHGIKVYPSATSTPPYGWMSRDGYTNPDGNNFVFIGFLSGSASLQQTVSGSWPYYETWVRQFFAYALIYDMSVNDALEHASSSLGWNWQFDQTPLYQGFTASWPMYRYNSTLGYYVWEEIFPPELRQGQLKIYGNGNLKLYQPLLTVNAYDTYNNPVSANVYIDNEFMGTTGNGFSLAPGSHSVSVQTNSYVFHNFAGYSEFQNPIQVSVSSATTVTANYYANPPPQYTLSISVTEGGTTQAPYTPGTYQFTPGFVSITAQPYGNYLFDHWVLDTNQHMENPITVTMTSNHELQAVFSPNPSYKYASSIAGYDGPVYNPDGLTGWQPDGQFAAIDGYGPYQYYGWISGAMNAPASGHIYVYGYGNGGPLYVYTSYDGYYYDLVSVPYVSSDSPYWIDCGTCASTFNYILLTAEDWNYIYGIAMDSVRVEP